MKNLILSLAFLLFGSVSAFATNKESVAMETLQKVSDVKSVLENSNAFVKQEVSEIKENSDTTVIIIVRGDDTVVIVIL